MDAAEAECLIGLGGNIGDVADTFRIALRQLSNAGCHVRDVSSVYQTAAMGADAGDPFLNAVARVATTLPPLDLLDLLQKTETRCGRIRELHWGPRRLDLDLLDYGNVDLSTDALVLPHPGIWYRRFVLEPLSEIAVDWVHPCLKFSVSTLLERLSKRPLLVNVDTVTDLPHCPTQFHSFATIRRCHVQDRTAMSELVSEAFCRIMCHSQSERSPTVTRPFVLNVDENGLQALVESVLTASLGRCEKCQTL